METTARPRRAVAIISILLALPVAAIAFWISLAEGESLYRFIADLDTKKQMGDVAWQVIERCRIVAWVLLPLAITQIAVGLVILWSILRAATFTKRGRRFLLGTLWLATILAVGLEAYWIPRMLPTVSLRAGLSRSNQTGPPPTPPDT